MKQKLILIFFILHSYIWAHPHTFIEVEPSIEIKNEKIEHFHLKWTLDEMTSMMLIMDIDINNDRKFDKEENDYIYENYFKSLSEQNFYMDIHSKKKKHIIKVKDFKALIEKDCLVYSFIVEGEMNLKNLKIDFYDEDLFVGMMIKKEDIKIAGIEKKNQDRLKKEIFGVN